jgi:multicomponent Na+:H+ antiporter subunit C
MIEPWFALVIGLLYACALYMILRRSMAKILVGLMLLSNAANLLLFVCGGLTPGAPALVAPGALAPEASVADPLAQALILTAIVIGFGVLGFAVVLIRRVYEVLGSDDLNQLETLAERAGTEDTGA